MSNVYFARPVTLSGPSRRLTEVPKTEGLPGHAHFFASSLMGCSGGFCGSATRHPLCFICRLEHPNEGPAAANVAIESFANLFGRGVRIFFQYTNCRHD